MMFKKLISGTLASLTFFSSLAFADFDRTKWYKIRPMGGSKVYDVQYGSDENGTRLMIWDDQDSDNQMFKFKKTMWGTYTIHPRHAYDKVLDVRNGTKNHGEHVILWDKHESKSENGYSRSQNQEWVLAPIGGDLYKITNVHSKLPLCFDKKNMVNQYYDMTTASFVELVEVD